MYFLIIGPDFQTIAIQGTMLRIVRLIAILRLIRLYRLAKLFKKWEDIVGMSFDTILIAMRMFRIFLVLILVLHVNTCLQYFIPSLLNYPPDSWVVLDVMEEVEGVKIAVKDLPMYEQYLWSLFKALSHMMCIGYGYSGPRGMTDLYTTWVSMMIGSFAFCLIIGFLTSTINSKNVSKKQYKEKIMQVKEYMGFRKFPMVLRHRMDEYYENRHHGKMFDEEMILDKLNPVLLVLG